jgi:hypothetical protein
VRFAEARLDVCVAHGGDEPFRVVAATLTDGRCVQCVKMDRRVPEVQLEMQIEEGDGDGVVG